MENKKKNPATVWKIVSCVLAIALIAVSCTWIVTAQNAQQPAPAADTTATTAVSEKTDANALSLWTDSAPLKKELTDYINTITDEGSKDFIPVADRIAVFDMDGTLCCETDPGYFDHKLLYHRVMEDESYKDKASEEEKETAGIIKEYFDTGEYPKGLDVKHGTAVATAFKGMTIDEFYAYVKDYKNTAMVSYSNMTNGQAFYKPMLQVIDYLQANDFTVYIVSGTDRLITRGLCDGVIDIPKSQMIGSDESLVASNQGDKDGLDYTFSKDDKVITGGGISAVGGMVYITTIAMCVWNHEGLSGEGWLAVALVIFCLWRPLASIWGSILFGALMILYLRLQIPFVPTELYKILPYVVTVIVLIISSLRNNKEKQPPEALGLAYFREDR